jgi:hypothetical protein
VARFQRVVGCVQPRTIARMGVKGRRVKSRALPKTPNHIPTPVPRPPLRVAKGKRGPSGAAQDVEAARGALILC